MPIRLVGSNVSNEAEGVVHANVGQKLLICYPIKSFLGDQLQVSDSRFMITNYYKRNSETTQPNVILITKPPPTNYILTLIKPFSFVW